MGHTRCADPGCSSRTGKGILFRKFPHGNQDLAPQWLCRMPAGLKVNLSTALCEKHFDRTQFEKPREDGRRKLRISAVPSIFSASFSSRKPLGDVTNIINVMSLPILHSPAVLHQAPCLSLSPPRETPKEPMICPTEEQETFAAPSPPLNSDSLAQVNRSGIETLNETSGLLEIVPDEAQYKEVFFTATGDDGLLHLDECTGEFYHSTDLPLTDDIYTETENDPVDIAHLKQLLEDQQRELSHLRSVVDEKDQTIAELITDNELNGNLRHKLKALRRANSQLEHKLEKSKASLSSPWLSDSQMQRLFRKSNRGLKWSTEDIREGLILKMRCGTSGYSAFEERFPLLPSARTLRESVQFIRFDSGILYAVFDLLKVILKKMPDCMRDCHLVFDEMAVEEGLKYCNSLKKFVGMATLPTHTGQATKALTFILAGVAKRWKLAVAVYFTNKKSEEAKADKKGNPTGKAYADIVHQIIVETEKVGGYVCALTSDMGPENLAFWKEKGVTGGKNTRVISSFCNPAREGANVTVLPDAIHVMKAVKKMMDSNGSITLPEDVVDQEGLLSAVVDYKHVDDLYAFETAYELKVAFRLRKENIHCNKQFQSMNVGTTKAVLCHRTSVGLNLLSEEIDDPTYKTTAWFFICLNTFFDLVTCKYKGLAVSHENEDSFNKAVALIKMIDHVFQHMTVGIKGEWKPVQRGIRVLCAGLLDLIDYFLVKRKYKFMMLGRFTSDCIENLHSVIRLSQPIPSAASFLQCLKVVTLAQFATAVRGSSYEYEKVSALPTGDILEDARKRAQERAQARFSDSLHELSDNPISKLCSEDYEIIDEWERKVLYDMAGSVIAAVLSSNRVHCKTCVDAVKWNKDVPHPDSVVTQMKEFVLLRSDETKGAHQISVSTEVFQAILTAEITFRLNREKTLFFKNADVLNYFVENLMYVWADTNIPNCHGIGRKVLSTFIDGRLKEYGKICREEVRARNAANNSITQLSSKSAAMHEVASKIGTASSCFKKN